MVIRNSSLFGLGFSVFFLNNIMSVMEYFSQSFVIINKQQTDPYLHSRPLFGKKKFDDKIEKHYQLLELLGR